MANSLSAAALTKQDFIEIIKAQGSSDETFFGYPMREDGLYLQQDPDEFAALMDFVANEVREASLTLDLGIASGGQTKFMRDYFNARQTIILDDGNHPMHHHWARIKPTIKTEIVCEIIDDSHAPSVREKLKPWYGKVDFAYVDGDHSYRGLRQDIFLMKHLIREGGLMVLHDTAAVWDCKKVFDDLLKSSEFHLYRNFDNRFGISVWIRAGRKRKIYWHNHAFGWGKL
ncbi:MAG: class I SAM-dependent methyltransferase [Rhizobiales bacterium]|nr:class I SAM-dependent methyltransferase [Hyphomicrobiales bacterium]